MYIIYHTTKFVKTSHESVSQDMIQGFLRKFTQEGSKEGLAIEWGKGECVCVLHVGESWGKFPQDMFDFRPLKSAIWCYLGENLHLCVFLTCT